MLRIITFIVLFYSVQAGAGIKIHVKGKTIKTNLFVIPGCNGVDRAYIYSRFGVTHIVFKSGATPELLRQINVMSDRQPKVNGITRSPALNIECPKKDESDYTGNGVPA